MKNISDEQLLFLRNIDYSFFSDAYVYSKLDKSCISLFRKTIYLYYEQFGRVFSWRETTIPYEIAVSEIMLQQTQTHRVVKKFEHFIGVFPNFEALASASFHDVLLCWHGLGYNRRAKALHGMAKKVVDDYHGILPNNEEALKTFFGIGPATAASICAFAYNLPTVFIETNIRSLFIHFFFGNSTKKISDKEIFPLVKMMLDSNNSRIWYYALTDFGVGLKKINPDLNSKSFHHTKQSKFEGSDRQIRGQILKIMVKKKQSSEEELVAIISHDAVRVYGILADLVNEGFIVKKNKKYIIS